MSSPYDHFLWRLHAAYHSPHPALLATMPTLLRRRQMVCPSKSLAKALLIINDKLEHVLLIYHLNICK